MKHAIYPGSFDPVTYGHIDIIKRAAEMFDDLTVCVLDLTVCVLDNKAKTPLFSVDERVKMLRKVSENIPNVRVDSYYGLLMDYARKIDCHIAVRGLRAVTDFEYELQIAHANRTISDGWLDTIFITSSMEFAYLSSSVVKEIASFGGDISLLRRIGNMSSKIEQMIDQIEDFIDSCRYQTFSKTNIIVDKDEMDALLEELRAKTPDEIRHYQRIIANKEAILDDAKRKAEEMINEATAHTNELVNEHEIMQQAYAQANEIVRMATQQAQDILDKAVSESDAQREAFRQYMEGMLADLEKSTISARNNMTSIFSNFHDEMSDYIDTIGQNLNEISPQPEEDEDSGLMQNMDGDPEDYPEEEEDDSEFVNTDMFEG